MALWLAGDAVASGQFDQIYPPVNDMFTMNVPAAWISTMAAEGYDKTLYPYIYPPLWAFALSHVSGLQSLGTAINVARYINPLLIVGTVLLAHRVAAPRLSQPLFLAAGLAFLSISTIGQTALYQNQPQILIAFLTVLAIERDECGCGPGADVVAGTALALAASIKVYPVLFALVWLLRGRWIAFATFLVIGAALGGLSVALAGWPLHRWFLKLLSEISHTAILTDITYTVSGSVSQLALPDMIRFVHASAASAIDAEFGWYVVRLPQTLAYVFSALMIASVLVCGWMMNKASAPERAALWPAVMILVALFGPISWTYHYLAAAAFLPMLLDRLGLRLGTALMGLIAASTFGGFQVAIRDAGPFILTTQVLGTVAVAGMAVAFLAVRRRAALPSFPPPLRPPPPSL